MKRFALAAGLFLLSTTQAFASLASCGSGTTAMTSGSAELFGNSFLSARSFSDCYSFSIGSESDAFGGTLTIDPLSLLDIDITSVTLSGAGLSTSLVDTTPDVFSFNALIAGTYQLIISGLVTNGGGTDDKLPLPAGYAGSLTTNAIITAVPEPTSLALLGLGLLGLAATRRRRRS